MMEGKVCLVTGATSALGKATAVGLAAEGATVVLLCRDREAGELLQYVIEDNTGSVKTDVIVGHLSDHTSVRQMVREFKRKYRRLDVLLNLDVVTLYSRQISVDGIEMTLATNLLGPFLLTYLLTDVLQKSVPSRIINVTSEIHRKGAINFDDIQLRDGYSGTKAARQSALLRVMWTYELARLLQDTGVTANCFSPGLVRTESKEHIPWFVRPFAAILYALKGVSPKQAAASALFLASSPTIEDWSGRYFLQGKETQSSWASYDKESTHEIWDIIRRLTGASY